MAHDPHGNELALGAWGTATKAPVNIFYIVDLTRYATGPSPARPESVVAANRLAHEYASRRLPRRRRPRLRIEPLSHSSACRRYGPRRRSRTYRARTASRADLSSVGDDPSLFSLACFIASRHNTTDPAGRYALDLMTRATRVVEM